MLCLAIINIILITLIIIGALNTDKCPAQAYVPIWYVAMAEWDIETIRYLGWSLPVRCVSSRASSCAYVLRCNTTRATPTAILQCKIPAMASSVSFSSPGLSQVRAKHTADSKMIRDVTSNVWVYTAWDHTYPQSSAGEHYCDQLTITFAF